MQKYGLGIVLLILFALVISVASFVSAGPQWELISQSRYNITDPISGSEYLPTRTFTFNITWNGSVIADLSNVTNVTFITNITGASVNYTSILVNGTGVINGTGNLFANYTINFSGVGPYEYI